MIKYKENNKVIKFKLHRGDNTMVKFKPIQATPELKGMDAAIFISQAFTVPKQEDIEKNENLLTILNKIKC